MIIYDITWCPNKDCSWEGCMRNQKRLIGTKPDPYISVSTVIPDDCPKAHKMKNDPRWSNSDAWK